MKPLKIAVVFSILAMMLSACAGSTQTELDGTTWVLTTFNEKSPIEGTQPTIKFDNDQVSGNTGCNLFSGSFQLNGDDISFGSLAWTERSCVDPEGVMEQERMYMQLMGAARRFELEDDELRIFTDSQEILAFKRQVDAPTASSLSTTTSPTATADMVANAETLTIEPPTGFKEYQASSIGVSVYIPENWTVTDVVEGQYVILQSYPENKYVGGEMLEAGDTKCDLGIRPSGTNTTELIEGWKSDPTTTILSEKEIILRSGLPGMRIEMDSMGRSISVITEINESVVVLNCFGDFSLFDEIAATLIASG